MSRRDLEEAFEGFEAAAWRHVPMTRRRRFWLRVRAVATFFGWSRLYWLASRKVWR